MKRLLIIAAFVAVFVGGGFWHQYALRADSAACPVHLLLGGPVAVNRALNR